MSAYDDPAAWVRRIAYNLAMSRWRKLKVAAVHLGRQRPGVVSPVDEEHVAVVAALRKLPAPQREAIVLHYMMDLPLAEVAEQVGVPVGTVKSWLHRSRSLLARELAGQIRRSVTVPPTEALLRQAAGRRTRAVVTAAVAVVLVLLGVAVWQVLRPNRAMPPVVPAPSPSPARSAPPGAIRQVDWSSATIDFDRPWPSCPSGKVALAKLETGPGVPGLISAAWPGLLVVADNLAYGDLDGDGEEEAVLRADCQSLGGVPISPLGAQELVAIQRRADGTLHTLGWIPEFGATVMERWISDGVLYVEPRPGAEPQMFGRVRGWRWAEGGFVHFDAYSRYPQLLPAPSGRSLDFSAATGSLRPCAGQPAPATLTFGADRLAKSGAQTWELGPGVDSPFGAAMPGGPRFLQLGRNGRAYLVAIVSCRPATGQEEHSAVVFDVVDGAWKPVAVAGFAEHGMPSVLYPNTDGSMSLRLPSGDDRLIRINVVETNGASGSVWFRFDGVNLTRRS